MSSAPGTRARTALRSSPVSGPPGKGSGWLPVAVPASGSRPAICRPAPLCPPPDAPGRPAPRVIAIRPEQGWSLLRNGVMGFGDTGALFPGWPVIEPGRMACKPSVAGTPQAGPARTVSPCRRHAREEGFRPCPAITGRILCQAVGPSASEGTPAMAERYQGDLQDATLDDVIDEAGEQWDCREIMGGYAAVPRESGGSPVPRVERTPGLLLAVIRTVEGRS